MKLNQTRRSLSMPTTFVRNQIAFGCELPINFDSLGNIKKERLGHLNTGNYW